MAPDETDRGRWTVQIAHRMAELCCLIDSGQWDQDWNAAGLLESAGTLPKILAFRPPGGIAYHLAGYRSRPAAEGFAHMATPSPNDLTRQQLDELDALLQRMLALPLNKPEPAVAYSHPAPLPLPDVPPAPTRPTSNGWRSDVPAPVAKVPHLTPEPVDESVFAPSFLPAPAGGSPVAVKPPPARPEPAPRLYTPPTPAADFAAPSGGPGTLRGVDAPAMPFGYTAPAPLPPVEEPDVPSAFAGMNFAEVNPFADPPSSSTPVPLPATSTSPPVPMLLWPLFALNAVIEYLLGWFGPLGQLLTRPWMKTLLGWVGVLLLIGAGVWAARGKGWVSWPR